MVRGGVGARDPDLRSAAEVDAADVVDVERGDVVDVPLHDPFEAVADAQDGHAFEDAADGGGADDAVDPRRGTAAHEDGELALRIHARRPREVFAAFLAVFLAVFLVFPWSSPARRSSAAFFGAFFAGAAPPSSFATVRRGAISR